MPHPSPLPPEIRGRAFSVQEGLDQGISESRMRRRDLQRPFHGVRSAGLDLSQVTARCHALGRILGPRRALSHVTAADVFGAPLPYWANGADRPLDVASIGGARMRRAGVRGHELPADTPLWRAPDGTLVVAPADTWCHLAAEASHQSRAHRIRLFDEDLIAVGDAFISGNRLPDGTRTPPLCTINDLAAAASRHASRRGATMIERCLPSIRYGVNSPRETSFRLRLMASGLPEPERGITIRTPAGTFYPDLGYERAGIALEYHGDHHRSDRHQWRRDFQRVRALQAAGWLVVAVTDDDLRDPHAWTELVTQLRHHVHERGA